MKEKDSLKTRRLILRPWPDEVLQEQVYNAASAHDKKMYLEMLTGCQIYPSHRLWHTNWGIYLRRSETLVGTINYKGHPNEEGAVEIGYEIFPDYQMQGYGTEACAAMVDWAFRSDSAYYIWAETEPGNAASQAMLKKLHFQPTDVCGAEGPRFVLERPAENSTKDMLALGVTFGLLAGVMMEQLNAGILIGAFAGLVIGGYLDAKDRRIREKLRNHRK